MSLLDDVSIVVTPNGYKAGELYAVVPVPVEGAEKVTNGDFVTDSNWNQVGSNGWSIDTGTSTLNFTSASSYVFQGISTVTGITYKVTLDIELNSGTIVAKSFSAQDVLTVTSTGRQTLIGYFKEIDSNANFGIVATGSASGKIYSISVKEYTVADMDVTRATAATRVDEAGLVNYAEIIGSDLVTNGDFADATGWTISGAWSLGTNKVIFSDTTNGDIRTSSAIFTATKTYQIKLKVADLTGANTAFFAIGDGSASNLVGYDNYANGDYTFNAIAPNGSELRIFSTTSSGSSYSITNISVKEVTRDNVPRIDYTGGGCPHILAEPQRLNEVTYSEDLNQASTVVNATVLLNQGSSPKGDNSANKFTADTVFPNARLGVTTVINQKYTTSIYAKYEGYQFILLDFKTNFNSGSSGAWFDIINGTIGTTQSDVTFTKIEQLSNNWYRISATSEATSSGTGQVRIHLCDTDGSNIIAGATGLSNFVWGFQLEVGSFSTSYIPTSGSTVTRNQDQFTRDGIGSLINSTEGVLFLEIAFLSETDASLQRLTINDGTNNNRIIIQANPSSNNMQIYLINSSGIQTSNTYTLANKTNFNKIAFKWKVNDFAVWSNGTEVITDTSGTTFSSGTLNTISFEGATGGNNLFGKVKQLQVYKTALTDAQLTSLTS